MDEQIEIASLLTTAVMFGTEPVDLFRDHRVWMIVWQGLLEASKLVEADLQEVA